METVCESTIQSFCIIYAIIINKLSMKFLVLIVSAIRQTICNMYIMYECVHIECFFFFFFLGGAGGKIICSVHDQ